MNTSSETKDKSSTNESSRTTVGWSGKCPHYLWDDVREFYEVEENEKMASLLVLTEQKRNDYIETTQNMREATDKYNVRMCYQRDSQSQINSEDSQLLGEIQNITYESLDLYNVLSHPLKELIEYVYNEMESIYNNDLKEFENEKIIKEQMYEQYKQAKETKQNTKNNNAKDAKPKQKEKTKRQRK